MMRLIIFFAIAIFTLAFNSNCEAQRLDITKVFQANKKDDILFIKQYDSSFYAITKSSSESGFFNSHTPIRTVYNSPIIFNYWLIKFDKNFTLQWKKNISIDNPNDVYSFEDDDFYPFIFDEFDFMNINNSGIYIRSYGLNLISARQSYTGTISKYDFNGNKLWVKNNIDTSAIVEKFIPNPSGSQVNYLYDNKTSNLINSNSNQICKYTVNGNADSIIGDTMTNNYRYMVLNMINSSGQKLWTTRLYDSLVTNDSIKTYYNFDIDNNHYQATVINRRITFESGSNNLFVVLSCIFDKLENVFIGSVIFKIDGNSGQLINKKYLMGYNARNVIPTASNKFLIISDKIKITDIDISDSLFLLKYDFNAGQPLRTFIKDYYLSDIDELNLFNAYKLYNNTYFFSISNNYDLSHTFLNVDNNGNKLNQFTLYGDNYTIPDYNYSNFNNFNFNNIFKDNTFIINSKNNLEFFIYNTAGQKISEFVEDSIINLNNKTYKNIISSQYIINNTTNSIYDSAFIVITSYIPSDSNINENSTFAQKY